MTKKNFINRLLQHTQNPNGFWGRMMLRGMNRGHAPLATWGMSHITWQTDWQVLDIGCGGGALAALLLKETECESVDAIDYSEECVAATSRRTRFAGSRCTVRLGDVGALPYKDRSFDIAKKYADKGLVVLSISVDKDRDAWLKALEEEQMPWTNLWDDAGIKVKYGVKGIPSVFLIQAADGTVLFEQLYGEAIRQQLKKILGE